jgi:hypothetical protein
MEKNDVKEKIVPTVEWCNVQSKTCVKFVFKGTLTGYGANLAVEKWKELFASKPNEKFNLVWICNDMTGYEPKARILWQDTMKSCKEQIDGIWLVTNSPIIKAGAMIMSAFTSYTIKVVNSEDKIRI